MKLQWLKAIIALPFNATVTIPFIILFFIDNLSFSSGALPIVFGALIFFAGLFLAVWTMLLFAKIGKGTLAPWAPTKKIGSIRPIFARPQPDALGGNHDDYGGSGRFCVFGGFHLGSRIFYNKYFLLQIFGGNRARKAFWGRVCKIQKKRPALDSANYKMGR